MRLLITAGPTHEPVDPVRYLANRSSGKMGFALAAEAACRGWQVDLIAGPVSLSTPEGVQRTDVETARDMAAAVAKALPACDAAIFAAAVADFRPADPAPRKIAKANAPDAIPLVANPDILGSARAPFGFCGVLVGFAAETQDLLENARAKLLRKQCDMLVANRVDIPGQGFGSDLNEITLLFPEGPPLPLALATKTELAAAILDHMPEHPHSSFSFACNSGKNGMS